MTPCAASTGSEPTRPGIWPTRARYYFSRGRAARYFPARYFPRGRSALLRASLRPVPPVICPLHSGSAPAPLGVAGRGALHPWTAVVGVRCAREQGMQRLPLRAEHHLDVCRCLFVFVFPLSLVARMCAAQRGAELSDERRLGSPSVCLLFGCRLVRPRLLSPGCPAPSTLARSSATDGLLRRIYDAPRLEASPLVVHTVMHALLRFVRRVYRGRVAVVCIMLWCVEILWLCRLVVLITM